MAPLTLLTALLIYFGWARTRAQMRYFGIDTSVLEFSTQDYVLRSVGSVFWPLGAILFAAVLAVSLRAITDSWLARQDCARRLRVTALGAGAVGLGSLALGLFRVVAGPDVGGNLLVTPTCFAFGIALTGFAVYVLARSTGTAELVSERFRRVGPLNTRSLHCWSCCSCSGR